MSSSTIPYCAVEERRRLNRCMEKASDDYEKEIYRKIRDMPVPYEKLDEILKDSRDIIISRQHRKNKFSCLCWRIWLFACSVCHVYYYGKAKGMIEWKRQNILERILAVYLRNIRCILQSLVWQSLLFFLLKIMLLKKVW